MNFINSHLLWIKYFLLIIFKSDIWRKYSCICQTKLLAKRAGFTVQPCIGLSPVSDWALYWAEPCIRLSPLSDWTCIRISLVSDWALYQTEPCIGLSPVSEWALYWTDWALYLTKPCTGLSPVLDWSLYWTEPCIRLSPVSDYLILSLLHWIRDKTFLPVWNLILGQTV